MNEMTPRLVVVGPGAIGGATAALLARAGRDVVLVCKKPGLAAAIAAEGIHISGARGDFRTRLAAVTTIEELEGTFDFALIAVKAPDLQDAARRLLPFLRADSFVVSMQNGICVEALAEVVGAERAVGCVVGWGSTLVAPGEIDVTSTGELTIGTLSGASTAGTPEGTPKGTPKGPPEGMEVLREALDNVFPTEIAPDILSRLYSKLIVNSCIASIGVLCGLRLGAMLARSDARSLFIAIIREAVAVADAIPLRVPPYAGKLDYYRLLAGSGPIADLRRTLFLRAFGFKYRRLKSSSLQSLERGHKTEIEYLNGYIERRGRAVGVPTPLNSRIAAMVREIEQGKRPISPANLAEAALRS
jgi:2-dehydropantoate 2-reductase